MCHEDSGYVFPNCKHKRQASSPASDPSFSLSPPLSRSFPIPPCLPSKPGPLLLATVATVYVSIGRCMPCAYAKQLTAPRRIAGHRYQEATT
eukprot:3869241-Rhodomonas_salina.1